MKHQHPKMYMASVLSMGTNAQTNPLWYTLFLLRLFNRQTKHTDTAYSFISFSTTTLAIPFRQHQLATQVHNYRSIVWQGPSLHNSSSIGTATLVGFGLLNYRWVFSAGRFLQSAVASGTSNPQPGGPVILEPSTLRHKVSPASETMQGNPSNGRWNYGREIADNFAKSGDFHVTFGFFYMP